MRESSGTNESADACGNVADLYRNLDLRNDPGVVWCRIQRSHSFTLDLYGAIRSPGFSAGYVDFANPRCFRVFWVGFLSFFRRRSDLPAVRRRRGARSTSLKCRPLGWFRVAWRELGVFER